MRIGEGKGGTFGAVKEQFHFGVAPFSSLSLSVRTIFRQLKSAITENVRAFDHMMSFVRRSHSFLRRQSLRCGMTYSERGGLLQRCRRVLVPILPLRRLGLI